MPEATFEAVIDSFIEKLDTPDANMGDQSSVSMGAYYLGGVKTYLIRALGKFDLSGIVGAEVLSARMERYLTGIGGVGANALMSRCTRPATWTELGVTWNKYDGVNAWTEAGGDFDDVGPPAVLEYAEALGTGWHTIEGLEDLAQDALLNRSGLLAVIMRLSDEVPGATTGRAWRAQDWGSQNWQLVVDYIEPAGHRDYPVTGQAGNLGLRPRRPRQPRQPRQPRRPRAGRRGW